MYFKNRKDFLSGICLVVLGIFIAFRSIRLSIWSRFGPDEGFFPLVIALIIIGLSLIITIKSLSLTRGKKEEIILEKRVTGVVNIFRVSCYIILSGVSI